MKSIELTKKEAEWVRGMAQNQLMAEEAKEKSTRASVFFKVNALFGEGRSVSFNNTYSVSVDPWDISDEDYDDIPF